MTKFTPGVVAKKHGKKTQIKTFSPLRSTVMKKRKSKNSQIKQKTALSQSDAQDDFSIAAACPGKTVVDTSAVSEERKARKLSSRKSKQPVVEMEEDRANAHTELDKTKRKNRAPQDQGGKKRSQKMAQSKKSKSRPSFPTGKKAKIIESTKRKNTKTWLKLTYEENDYMTCYKKYWVKKEAVQRLEELKQKLIEQCLPKKERRRKMKNILSGARQKLRIELIRKQKRDLKNAMKCKKQIKPGNFRAPKKELEKSKNLDKKKKKESEESQNTQKKKTKKPEGFGKQKSKVTMPDELVGIEKRMALYKKKGKKSKSAAGKS